MDNIFGIGLPEFILILIIAGMLMGPERIARTARTLGTLTAKLQSVSRAFLRQLNAELDSVDQDGQLRSTVDELNQLRRQVAELRGEIMSLAGGAAADTQQAVRQVKRETENAIAPPDLSALLAKPPVQLAQVDETEVYQPPSLMGGDREAANAQATNGPVSSALGPAKLPRPVKVSDDPDE